MKRKLAGKYALLMALAIMLNLLPSMSLNTAAFSDGESFKLYANNSLNAKGRSYFYGVSKEAKLQTSGERVTARYFHWGDGIMYEPSGGLNGFNTKITIGHYATKDSSDLAAEVIYVENGVEKVSPSYGFTGRHVLGRQTDPTATTGVFDIGMYPNVVGVNVWHTMSESVPFNADSTPNHWYVQFDIKGNAGGVIPPETEYYIENRVQSSYSRGKPISTPAPAAAVPVSGDAMPQYVTPAPIGDSPVVPLGLGASFTLYSSNYDYGMSVSPPYYLGGGDNPVVDAGGSKKYGPFAIEDVAKISNLGIGVTSFDVVRTDAYFSRTSGGTYNRTCALLEKPNGSSVIYTPKAGLLKGVETRVTYTDHPQNNGLTVTATVTYDGGKVDTIPVVPPATKDSIKSYEVGIFKDLECVRFKVDGSNYAWFVPECRFTVVNENPGQDLTLTPRKYLADLLQITPPAPTPRPVANTVSPISINEVCAKVTKGDSDAFGELSDWIELYNSSDSAVNIGGYGLTDNTSKPFKWTFPKNTVIPAEGRLVVFCSGRNTVFNNEIHTGYSLSKSGETLMLSNPDGGIINVISLPKMEDDRTLSRVPDGSENLKTTYPTRKAANTADIIAPYVPKPEFSKESGFYKGNFDLTLSSEAAEIYYTLDGSVPQAGKPGTLQYDAPMNVMNRSHMDNIISEMIYQYPPGADRPGQNIFKPAVKIDKSTVVRAVSVDSQGNASEVVSKSYFVDLDIQTRYNNMPVLSFSTDTDGILDEEYGIFPNGVQRGRLWERPAHMSFFERDGSLVLDQDCGISVRGFGSRLNDDQKSLSVTARGVYGEDSFDYDIFNGETISKVDGSPITSFKEFALRGGFDGTRSQGARYMDYMVQGLSRSLDTAWQAGRSCVVFINGEFWGTYCLQEKLGTAYIESYYGIPESESIVIKTNLNAIGDTTRDDVSLLSNDRAWLGSTDFSKPENYAQLTAKFDVDQIIRFFAVNLAVGNHDLGGYNFATFRSRSITDRPFEDGKWRCLLYDMDASHINLKLEGPINEMLRGGYGNYLKGFATNPALKAKIVNLATDIGFGLYSVQNLIDNMQYEQDIIEPTSSLQLERWNYKNSNANLSKHANISGHPPWRIKNIKDFYGLKGNLTHLNVRVNDSSMGTVLVNGISHDYSKSSYTGWFLNDFTTNLVAVPKPGYVFAGWEKSEGSTLSSETDAETFVTIPDNGARAVAIFRAKGEKQITAFVYKDGEADTSKAFYTATDGDKSATLEFYRDGQTLHNIGAAGKTPVNAPKTAWTAGGSPDNSSAWQIKLSTKGYGNIYFNAAQKSTGSGPAEWGLAYRIGSAGPFIPIENSNVKITGVGDDTYGALQASYCSFKLPDEVNDQSEVYIKVYMTSLLDASGREVVQNNGNTSINNIEFRGDPAIVLRYNESKNTAEIDTSIAVNGAKLIAASYDGETLVDVKIIDFTAGAGTENEVPLPINPGGQIRLMLWNDMGIISPMADSTPN